MAASRAIQTSSELDAAGVENYRTSPMHNAESSIANVRRTPLGSLPARLRMLQVSDSARAEDWLAEALAADRATAVQIEQATGAEAALARLRDEVFDAIVVHHVPGCFDALDLAEAIRGLGVEEPLVVLGDADSVDLAAQVYEIGGDAYLCAASVSTRTLLWTIGRAMEHRSLARENRRLAQCEQNRLCQEQDDARRLLADQRALVQAARQTPVREAPAELREHYCQLLRTHVIMGAGNLGEEIGALAHMLAGARMTAEEALAVHLDALEELIRGLGNRSARHIMTRADLLALDLLCRLTESYRSG